MEESYSPTGELREVMISFLGDDNARTYTIDEVEYERLKRALLDDSKTWVTIAQYGMRRTVFINKDNIKRVIM